MEPHRSEPFDDRKTRLTKWVAEKYNVAGSGGVLGMPQTIKGPPDPQKYVWPKVIARLSHDENDPWAHAALHQFWNVGGEPAPHASSFYHFAAYGLVRLLLQFPNELASLRAGILTQAMREEQLFSGTGTENHIAMWRTSGYLLAQEARDEKRIRAMRDWAMSYADRLQKMGQGEWDSSTYATFAIASWLNLLDFARDKEVQNAARRTVTFLADALALKYMQGTLAGAEKRGWAGQSASAISAYTGWLWFGDVPQTVDDFFFTQSAIYSLFPALSGFRPSKECVALARKGDWKKAETYCISKPNYAMTRPGEAREILHITPHYAVGTSVRSPIGGWGGGDTQETLWKWAARTEKSGPHASAYVIGGAGASYGERSKYVGEGRGPWDQTAQWENVVFVMTCVPANAKALTRDAHDKFDEWKAQGKREAVSWADPQIGTWAYLSLPADADITEQNGVLLIRCEKAWAAFRPLHGAYSWQDNPQPGRKIARTEGGRNDLIGWVGEFGDQSESTFADFQATVTRTASLSVDGLTATYTDRKGRVLRAEFVLSGTYNEPEYDWGPQPVWPTGRGSGRVPRLFVGANRTSDVLAQAWPFVVDGPRLRIPASAHSKEKPAPAL